MIFHCHILCATHHANARERHPLHPLAGCVQGRIPQKLTARFDLRIKLGYSRRMTDKRIYISPELHARIKALSDRYGIPIQTLTSMAFEEWLDVVEKDGIHASR